MLSVRFTSARCHKQVVRQVQWTISHRDASLTSAINDGVRKAGRALQNAQKRRVREGTLGSWELKDQEKVAQSNEFLDKRRKEQYEQRERLAFLKAEPELDAEELTRRKKARATAARQGMLTEAPAAIPYTHAASEFLYGSHAVRAALQANRRKFYKLYIWCGEDGNLADDAESAADSAAIVKAANAANVPIARVAGNWYKMMDRMSDRRPHNGFVLEAAAIRKVPARALWKVPSLGARWLRVELRSITAEEKEQLHVRPHSPVYEQERGVNRGIRYHFLLWLDKITDTGNMGAILRTAYFFGVDAIIVPRHGTAPISALTIKTSAGAAELLPIFEIENELDFMKKSQENGWIFYATGAGQSRSTLKRRKKTIDAETSPEAVLKSHPCVLMLGNENHGLAHHLQNQADHILSIKAARNDSLIDSLNVSVTAALLIQRFMSTVPVIAKEADE